jgi:hypothetical protein
VKDSSCHRVDNAWLVCALQIRDEIHGVRVRVSGYR